MTVFIRVPRNSILEYAIRIQVMLTIVCMLSHSTYGQKVSDSVFFSILKLESSNKNLDTLEILVANNRSIPICVLHSSFIKLLLEPPQNLAVWRVENGVSLFNLHYSLEDSKNDYENENPNYDGEIILPLQEMRFRVLIPKVGQMTRILIEHIDVPNFCYTKFEYAIAHDQTNWYKQYKKHSNLLDIVK